MVKFGELCGSSMNLKCKLPSDDLDLLVTSKSDKELRAVIKDYESALSPVAKIRAMLFSVRSAKKASDPSSPMHRVISPGERETNTSFSPSMTASASLSTPITSAPPPPSPSAPLLTATACGSTTRYYFRFFFF
ncbi:diphosphomevalonate decarboxylase [Phtheirospermum japonicum]|uniref:Diphosphomevalonate decarboxylase n=1 Tax=Phtheirospermum japonicum TaxID=374723 RepID=A0A830CIN2_9LAMI|nr:diphosphomevalonate decarboxylase [Phtheirospermum japonicum]